MVGRADPAFQSIHLLSAPPTEIKPTPQRVRSDSSAQANAGDDPRTEAGAGESHS